jgi:hypothetical protein
LQCTCALIARVVEREREQREHCSREVHRLNSELDAARERLADLRAKVVMLPAHAVRMEYEWLNGTGWVPSGKVIDTVRVDAVLALLDEEAQP